LSVYSHNEKHICLCKQKVHQQVHKKYTGYNASLRTFDQLSNVSGAKIMAKKPKIFKNAWRISRGFP